MFGENPREGVVRGNAFLHPDLRFRLEFPAGWRVQNSPQQVVAQPPGGEGFVFLQLVQPQGRTLQEVAANDLGQSGLQFVDGQETRINGLPAFVGTFQGQMQQMGDVVLRSAWISHDNQVFRLAGLAPTSAYRQLQQVVDASVRSFQPLSAAEAERIRPTVLDALHGAAGRHLGQHRRRARPQPRPGRHARGHQRLRACRSVRRRAID